jgi:DHA2 family methylenomycin A resistance protein-like MFS transporter
METEPAAAHRPFRSRQALLAVCIAVAVVGLNSTAVGVATRGIADELQVSLTTLEWIMSAYLVTAAAFSLGGGRLGDVIGRSRTLVIGIAVMIGGSVVAAIAPGSTVLIVGRAVQGLGAALILPSSIEVIAAHSAATGPSSGFRARGVVYSTAFGIGPLVGGLLTDAVSWRAVFWLEVVGLVIAGTIALPVLRASARLPTTPTRDIVGAGLAAVIVFLVVFGASRSHEWGWFSWPMAALGSAAGGLGLVLVRVEARNPHPLIHRSVLHDRTVIAANLATLGASIGMIGLVYFYGLFAMTALVFNSTALSVALGLIPFTLSIIGFALISGWLARRLGRGGPVLLGLGLSVVGFAWLSRVTVDTTQAQLYAPLILCGLGAGVANAGLTSPAVMTDRRRIDEAAGLISLTRSLGSALAVAIGTASYLAVVGTSAPATELPPGAELGSGDLYARAVNALRAGLQQPFVTATHTATTAGFAAAMRVAAVAVAVLTVASAACFASGRRLRGASVRRSFPM